MSGLVLGRGRPEAVGLGPLHSRRLALLGPRLFDFIPLLRLVHPEVALVCETGPDAEGLAAAAGARLWTSEGGTDHRAQHLSFDVDELIPMLSRVAAMADPEEKGGRPLTILAYGATGAWEQAVAATGGRTELVAAGRHGLKGRLDDKIGTRRRFTRLGIPTPAHARVEAGGLEFNVLSRRFGCPFVVQEPVGASGVGTFVVAQPSDMEAVRQRAREVRWWLVSSHVKGPVVNVHGLVAAAEVSVAAPSVQLSGIPELGVTSASYNGNDFGAAEELSPRTLESVWAVTAEIGRWLCSVGYRGAYGVDYIVDGSEVWALEVNPRLQGSSWLLGELEMAAGRAPLMVDHFLELLDVPTARPAASAARQAKGGVLIVRWSGTSPVSIRDRPRPGIHAIGPDGTLEYRRPGIGLLECGEGDFVITGLPPAANARVEPGAPLARVASWERLGGSDGRSLTAFGSRMVGAVLGGFGLPAETEIGS